MKKQKKVVIFILALCFSVMGLSAKTALASVYTIDGNLSDWGVTPFVNWVPTSLTAAFTVENNTVRPYSDPYNPAYHELYDLEAMYFDDGIDAVTQRHYLYFAVVSSSPYYNGWASEDLGIDLNGDGIYEYAAEVAPSKNGMNSGQRVWSEPQWNQLYRTHPGLPAKWFPYSVVSGIELGIYELYNAAAGNLETDAIYYPQTYILEGRIDLALFGGLECNACVELYLPRVTCLKDWITVRGYISANCPTHTVIPEPGTMMLLGGGLLAGLGYLRRGKKR